MDGHEVRVDLSSHSIELDYVDPNGEDVAWDPNLYRRGNVFYDGYSNPIKPKVNVNEDLEEPDTVDVHESEVVESDEDAHVKLISSARFKAFMRQQLIESLLNPREHWKMVVYGLIALGGLQFITMVLVLYATGSF